jgi:ureidoglycolate lyase
MLTTQPLTAEAFARYGTVVQAPAGDGRSKACTAGRLDLVNDLPLGAPGGRPLLALFRAQRQRFPHAVRALERHALGRQTFVPLGERRFVVVVALADKPPSAATLAAFITDGHQGVVLAPGTWHHALLAVDAGDFVVVERAAASADCERCPLERAISVFLAS